MTATIEPTIEEMKDFTEVKKAIIKALTSDIPKGLLKSGITFSVAITHQDERQVDFAMTASFSSNLTEETVKKAGTWTKQGTPETLAEGFVQGWLLDAAVQMNASDSDAESDAPLPIPPDEGKTWKMSVSDYNLDKTTGKLTGDLSLQLQI